MVYPEIKAYMDQRNDTARYRKNTLQEANPLFSYCAKGTFSLWAFMLVPKMIVAKKYFLLYNYICMFCMYSWICLIYWSLGMTVLVSKRDVVHLNKK